MTKNDKLTGICQDYTYDGLGLVRTDAGFCVFVKDMLVGESGTIIITKDKKNYAYGRLLKREVISPHRAVPTCPLFKACGGCQLQHFDADEQARFKTTMVQQNLDRIGSLKVKVKSIISMAQPDHYRNKVQLPWGKNANGEAVMGFYRYNSHEIIPLDECLLQDETANIIARHTKALIITNHLEDLIRHLIIKSMPATKQAMVVLVLGKKPDFDLSPLANQLAQQLPQIKSVLSCINDQDTNVIWGHDEKVLYGQAYIEDELLGCRFMISGNSFYQVNSRQTAVLYQAVMDLAQLKADDTLLDLYCGVGTIGIVAAKKVKKVIGVEIVEAAVANAKANAQLNGLTNTEYICADASLAVKTLGIQKIKPDVIVVDPPRKGCSMDVLQAIYQMAPDRLIYVSCNPSTLARDLAILQKMNYDINEVQPVDMFPQTYHVETVVLMSRVEGK